MKPLLVDIDGNLFRLFLVGSGNFYRQNPVFKRCFDQIRFDRLLERKSIDRVYTCGSRRFARYVQQMDREGRWTGFVFLEGLMACGLGDCHGCAVRKKKDGGYFLVCRDGPHFPIGEVEL